MSCNCYGGTEFDGTWVGTVLKYKVEITVEGFSMDDDDFEVEIRRGNKSVILEKSDLLIHEVEPEGSGSGSGSGEPELEYYMLVDTEALGPGKYEVITRAYVPDDDIEGGVRPEIDKQTLIIVNAV